MGMGQNNVKPTHGNIGYVIGVVCICLNRAASFPVCRRVGCIREI